MADIQTADEAGMIAAFLAMNPVTKCPPRYLERVTGAVPMTDGVASTVIEKTARQKWSEAANAAKARRKAECEKREAATDERRERARVALAIVQQRQRERVASKVGEVLRFIGDDWTWAKIGQAVKAFGYSKTSSLTQFLRQHGHGGKIPERQYQASKWQPKKREKPDTSKRDAGILADYKAGMFTRDIRAKWKVGGRVIKSVVEAAGVECRQGSASRVVKTVPPKQDIQPSAEDYAIAAMFQAGFSVNKCAVKFGKSWDGAAYAISRCGVDLNTRRVRVHPASDADRAITAFYLAGNGRNKTAITFNVSTKKVERALLRCGVSMRTSDEAVDMVAARGAL